MKAYAEERARLLARPGPPGPGRRRALAELTDRWLASLFALATEDQAVEGLALVAVGGYGRGVLSPGSDVDVLLLHDGRPVADIADALWYPVWDSGLRLDHAVRRVEEAREVAAGDIPAALGLLDARLVAGDAQPLATLRDAVRADWRRDARSRLPQLRETARERERRHGDVAYAVEPELKEGRGGLRDVACLRAISASWTADRPHGDLDSAESRLLDVRDALHLVAGRAGRATDTLLMQEQDAVATRLGLADADSVLRVVSEAARVVDYAAEITWRQVERALAPRRRGLRVRGARPRRPVVLRPGMLVHEGELVLDVDAPVATDPVLPLRVAAAAAEAGLPLSPASAERLTQAPDLPEPWPSAARDALLALLGSGPGLLPVWEDLDQAGLVVRMLPEWAAVRARPQRSAVHRWTVDRHLVETVVAAASLARAVARPDLLLLAALLHDIGKGRRRGDHSREGARIAEAVGLRMGLPPDDLDTVVGLVRHHLLLSDSATRRDLEDPATAATVADAVGSPGRLELLAALTEADSLGTGSGVWTEWRAGLVAELVGRTAAHLRGEPPAASSQPSVEDQRLLHEVAATQEPGVRVVDLVPGDPVQGATVTVAAPDQRGLIAAVAGVLALHRLSVRGADMRTETLENGAVALDSWVVVPEYGEAPDVVRLREDVRRALVGRFDVAAALDKREASRGRSRRTPTAPPRVDVVDSASATATVFEVRAHDRPALLHRLGRALALAGLDVRAARVATLGAEVVDVFYVVDDRGLPLSDARARETARILRDVAG